jgi:uncharacterized protein YjbJ (UPF0337 family)
MQPVCTAGLAMYVPFGTDSRNRCVSQKRKPVPNSTENGFRYAQDVVATAATEAFLTSKPLEGSEQRFWRPVVHAVRHVPTFKSPRGVNNMKTGTRNEIEGKVHELKGDIKHKVGQVTNDPGLEAEGVTEKIAGKIQKKIGRVQKAVAKS